jgi:hypothetical protein
MVVITEMEMRKEDIKYVGRASRTAERRTSLPPLDRRLVLNRIELYLLIAGDQDRST